MYRIICEKKGRKSEMFQTRKCAFRSVWSQLHLDVPLCLRRVTLCKSKSAPFNNMPIRPSSINIALQGHSKEVGVLKKMGIVMGIKVTSFKALGEGKG